MEKQCEWKGVLYVFHAHTRRKRKQEGERGKKRERERERERSRGVGEISIRVAGPGQKLGLRHGLEVGSHGLEREMWLSCAPY